MASVSIVGIDLSGPSNTADTAIVVLRAGVGSAVYSEHLSNAGDAQILELVTRLARDSEVSVGIDAPLSYEPGGGLRHRDRALQRLIVQKGMRPGSVMPPTFNRMAYLTLRGIAIARLLTALSAQIRVVEVHPGAAFCLRGAPLESVLAFKAHAEHRISLLKWLAAQGVQELPCANPTDHFVAASGAALATWHWSRGESAWLAPADPPFHPFPFAS